MCHKKNLKEETFQLHLSPFGVLRGIGEVSGAPRHFLHILPSASVPARLRAPTSPASPRGNPSAPPLSSNTVFFPLLTEAAHPGTWALLCTRPAFSSARTPGSALPVPSSSPHSSGATHRSCHSRDQETQAQGRLPHSRSRGCHGPLTGLPWVKGPGHLLQQHCGRHPRLKPLPQSPCFRVSLPQNSPHWLSVVVPQNTSQSKGVWGRQREACAHELWSLKLLSLDLEGRFLFAER